MSQRLTSVLGWLTLVLVIGALWVLFGEDPTKNAGERGGPLFDDGATRFEAAEKLSLTSGGDVAGLVKVGDTWVVATRDDFPADAAKVRALLRGLILSKRREPKTGNLKRFDQLGLGEDGLALLVSNQTQELASLKVGKRSEGATGRSLTYVYRDGDSRAWLVSDLPALTAQSSDWLADILSDIDDARLKSASFPGYTLERSAQGMVPALSGLQDGEEMEPDWKRTGAFRTLGRLAYQDVKALGNPLYDPLTTVTLDSFDGLRLTFTVYELNDGADALWFALKADYDGARAVSDSAETTVIEGAPADGASEAAALNAAATGWLFKATDAMKDVLTRGRDGYITAAPAN